MEGKDGNDLSQKQSNRWISYYCIFSGFLGNCGKSKNYKIPVATINSYEKLKTPSPESSNQHSKTRPEYKNPESTINSYEKLKTPSPELEPPLTSPILVKQTD